ncbi:hypothetical protein FRC18_004422 [Serendipita sp. 400]|nr:hypothetical protein FRC18_004422 [Serendipita sp. 400]
MVWTSADTKLNDVNETDEEEQTRYEAEIWDTYSPPGKGISSASHLIFAPPWPWPVECVTLSR